MKLSAPLALVRRSLFSTNDQQDADSPFAKIDARKLQSCTGVNRPQPMAAKSNLNTTLLYFPTGTGPKLTQTTPVRREYYFDRYFEGRVSQHVMKVKLDGSSNSKALLKPDVHCAGFGDELFYTDHEGTVYDCSKNGYYEPGICDNYQSFWRGN
jgi:hypothetical protein